jgi:hypothetical protein
MKSLRPTSETLPGDTEFNIVESPQVRLSQNQTDAPVFTQWFGNRKVGGWRWKTDGATPDSSGLEEASNPPTCARCNLQVSLIAPPGTDHGPRQARSEPQESNARNGRKTTKKKQRRDRFQIEKSEENARRKSTFSPANLGYFQIGADTIQEVIVAGIGKLAREFSAAGLEGVGNVFDEDEAKDNVLVFGSVHIGAQLVGGGPECFLDVFDHAEMLIMAIDEEAILSISYIADMKLG